MEAVQEPEEPEAEQEVTVEVIPDTVAGIIYFSDYQIVNECGGGGGSPNADSEDTCDTEYEIGSVDTTKFPGSDFVLDESGTIVLLASDEFEQSAYENSHELLTCEECKFQTASREKLEAHQLLHSEDHHCVECFENFCSYALLMKHIRDEHAVLHCFVCKIEVKGSKAHRTHLRQHEMQCEYSCSTCKKGFESDDELMKHMKTHGALLLYACNICDEAFSKMNELSAHLKQAHPK